jgi:hypothetical protein
MITFELLIPILFRIRITHFPLCKSSNLVFSSSSRFHFFIILYYYEIRYTDGLRTGRPEFDSRQRQEMFFFSTASRPALRPTKPSIQWVPEALHRQVKRPGREAYHSPPSSAEFKNGINLPPLLHTSSWRGA